MAIRKPAEQEIAVKQKRRAIILETQSCNTNAIGFDKCCYRNNDIQRHEIRINLSYFFDVEGRWG